MHVVQTKTSTPNRQRLRYSKGSKSNSWSGQSRRMAFKTPSSRPRAAADRREPEQQRAAAETGGRVGEPAPLQIKLCSRGGAPARGIGCGSRDALGAGPTGLRQWPRVRGPESPEALAARACRGPAGGRGAAARGRSGLGRRREPPSRWR